MRRLNLLFILALLMLSPLPVSGEWGQYILTYDKPRYYRIDTTEMEGARVEIKATVIEGDSIDIFLVNDENMTSYKNSSHVFYIKEASALNVTDFSADVTLPGGVVYWFIFQVHVDENTTLEDARSKASTVHWDIKVEVMRERKAPIYLLMAGIVFLGAGLAFLIRAIMLKKAGSGAPVIQEKKGGPGAEAPRPEVHRGSTEDLKRIRR